jgi:hypothetical protein
MHKHSLFLLGDTFESLIYTSSCKLCTHSCCGVNVASLTHNASLLIMLKQQVEFQNKFYKADGYKFQPFNFFRVLEAAPIY